MKKLMKNKKAQFMIVLSVIITVIAGTLLIILGYQIHQHMKNKDKIEVCRMSILANDQLGRLRQGSESQVKFSCPRIVREIELEDVENRGRISDDKIKDIIGAEMKECWSMIGAGKLDPFRSMGSVNENYCLICKDIVFSEDLIQQAQAQNYEFLGFHYWVMARKMSGSKGTLYQHVRGERPTPETLNILMQTANNPLMKVNMNQRYSILWRVEKYEPGLPTSWREGLNAIQAVFSRETPVFMLPSRDPVGRDLGMTIGIGVTTRRTMGGTTSLYQQLIFAPEERLSMPFQSGDRTKDFCSQMIN